MLSFAEYQSNAAKVPIALRNDRDRIELLILGLQEEAGKLGRLLSAAFASGKFQLTPAESSEVRGSVTSFCRLAVNDIYFTSRPFDM